MWADQTGVVPAPRLILFVLKQGLAKASPMPVWLTTCFCTQGLIGTKPHPAFLAELVLKVKTSREGVQWRPQGQSRRGSQGAEAQAEGVGFHLGRFSCW